MDVHGPRTRAPRGERPTRVHVGEKNLAHFHPAAPSYGGRVTEAVRAAREDRASAPAARGGVGPG
ncbi:hypothetical protein GFH48_10355 [Streptomyces fagopyri]|uniref:Uncharacterized protein n=1 Tax=Streptomyces fagopyri TaxID=2662397 RepID=A0A5Q0L9J0_9ACTN|nr:hypothetical protein GFH48_10355 [Streptomyces fagopyri]